MFSVLPQHRTQTLYNQDDEENLGLLFWDELPPGDNATTSGVSGGGGGEGGNGEENEIPIINPTDQSAEYMGDFFGMQHAFQENNHNAALNGHLGDGLRTSPGASLVNLSAKSVPNVVLQPSTGSYISGNASCNQTNNTTRGTAATLAGMNYAEIPSFFPSASCGNVPSLLEAQEVRQQQQVLGNAALGISALSVAAVAGGGITNRGSAMLSSSLATSGNGNDGQSFLQVANINPTNVHDQWSLLQLQQSQQLPIAVNSLQQQLPTAAVNMPPADVASTSPHPYMMWLLQQQAQQSHVPQGQPQALLQVQHHILQGQGKSNQDANSSEINAPPPANVNNAASSSATSAAQMTLNQLQLIQLLQMQQHQQQLQTAASQQQQQSNLMHASAELHSIQTQLQQQSVNVVGSSGATPSWLVKPRQLETPSQQQWISQTTATRQSRVPVNEAKNRRATASTTDATNCKRKSEIYSSCSSPDISTETVKLLWNDLFLISSHFSFLCLHFFMYRTDSKTSTAKRTQAEEISV